MRERERRAGGARNSDYWIEKSQPVCLPLCFSGNLSI